MRCRVDPGGWQANSVAVDSGVCSMMYIASGATTVGAGHEVHEATVGGGEDHLVADLELVDVPERLVVAGAMTGDDDVAELARHRRAGPVPGREVERVQRDALEQRLDDADPRDLDRAELDVGLVGARRRRCRRDGRAPVRASRRSVRPTVVEGCVVVDAGRGRAVVVVTTTVRRGERLRVGSRRCARLVDRRAGWSPASVAVERRRDAVRAARTDARARR